MNEWTPSLGPPFRNASVGGTFEGLHLGHRQYLERAARLAANLHVWVTGDGLAHSRKPYVASPCATRRKAVVEYVDSLGYGVNAYTYSLDSDIIMENFVLNNDIDLVVVEPAYLQWFRTLSETRRVRGKAEFFVLVKPRTVVNGVELSATSQRPAPATAVSGPQVTTSGMLSA